MSKGEMAVIVTISWIAGLVVLALVFTISDHEQRRNGSHRDYQLDCRISGPGACFYNI